MFDEPGVSGSKQGAKLQLNERGELPIATLVKLPVNDWL